MPILTTHIQHSTGNPSHSKEAREKKMASKKENQEVELSLFVNDMILCIENLKDSTRKLLELINKFSRVIEDKINIQQSVMWGWHCGIVG